MRALKRLAFTAALFLLGIPQARAGDAMLFGPEFTFTNPAIVKRYGEDGGKALLFEYRDRYRSAIESICAGRPSGAANACKVRFFGDDVAKDAHWYVEYPNVELDGGRGKLRVTVGHDPYVIETQVTPMTIDEWKQNKKLLQTDLFDSMKEIGLRPHAVEGGGHLNMGFQYFKEHPQALSAFVDDLSAHPEVAMGGFGIHEPDQALPASMLPADSRKKLARLTRELREGKFDAEEFVRRVQAEVYGKGKGKYQAFNLEGVVQTNPALERVELRPVAAQRSMDEFISDISLIDGRVKFLEREAAAGRYPDLATAVVRTQPRDLEDLSRRMRRYVEEAGLAWEGPGGFAQRSRMAWGSAVDAAKFSSTGPCQSPARFFEEALKGL